MFNLHFSLHGKVRVEPTRERSCSTMCKNHVVQRLMDTVKHTAQDHLIVLNVGDCMALKPTSKLGIRLATCVLCQGSRPENYKECTVCQDLINARTKKQRTQPISTPSCYATELYHST